MIHRDKQITSVGRVSQNEFPFDVFCNMKPSDETAIKINDGILSAPLSLVKQFLSNCLKCFPEKTLFIFYYFGNVCLIISKSDVKKSQAGSSSHKRFKH